MGALKSSRIMHKRSSQTWTGGTGDARSRYQY